MLKLGGAVSIAKIGMFFEPQTDADERRYGICAMLARESRTCILAACPPALS